MVNNFVLRTLSTIILAPLVIFVLYHGGICLQVFALICLFLMLHEWFSMNKRDKTLITCFVLALGAFVFSKLQLDNVPIHWMRYVMYALCIMLVYSVLLLNDKIKLIKILSSMLLVFVSYMIIHMLVAPKPHGAPVKDLLIFAGSIVIPCIASVFMKKQQKETKFFTTGLIYIIIPMFYVIFKVSEGDESFFKIALWTLVVVWSGDVFAYLGGRLIGGAKLAPSISPQKTWAGVIVGTLSTLLIVYFGVSKFINIEKPYLLSLSLVMIIASVLGDLLESKAKRILNVKDSGNIIPGHGGILDRLDSLLMVLYIFVLMETLWYLKLDFKMLLTSANWI